MSNVNVFEYYLKGNPSVIRFECIEVSHPAWLKTYRYVRNAPQGLSVKHDSTGATYEYEHYPLVIEKAADRDDLDQSITLGVGDLGEDFPREIDRIRASDEHSNTMPTVNYREYLSTDLTKPFDQILNMKVTDYNPTKQGASFVAQADRLNLNGSGYTFNTLDMPCLIGAV